MDVEEEVRELQGRMFTVEEGVKNLVRWQESQNGSIHYVRNQVDGMEKTLNKILTRVTFAAISIAVTAVFLCVQVT